MWYENEWMHSVYKAVFQGSGTAVLTGALYGFANQVKIPGFGTYYLMGYTFVVGAATSVVCDVVTKLIDDEMHIGQKAEESTNLMVSLAASAIVYTFSMSVIEPISAGQIGTGTNLAVGAGSDLIANWANSFIPIT